MSREIHVFRTPDRFVAGTVGQPGNRTFYLQAVHDQRVISVILEKQQVAVLADRLGSLITEVARRFGVSRSMVYRARDEFGHIPGGPAPTTTHPDRRPVKRRRDP